MTLLVWTKWIEFGSSEVIDKKRTNFFSMWEKVEELNKVEFLLGPCREQATMASSLHFLRTTWARLISLSPPLIGTLSTWHQKICLARPSFQ